MKIGFVITNLRGGGAEKAVLKLATALGRRGHEVHVFLIEQAVDYAVPDVVRLHALGPEGKPVSKGYFGKRFAARRLARRHREIEHSGAFDLTISTLPFADEVTALARLPRAWFRIANSLSAEIVALRAGNPRKAARRLRRYRRLYEGRNLIAVSDGVLEDLREHLGLHSANIVRLYNVFDVAAIRALAEHDESDIPREPYVIHIGRFAAQKRHDLLFAAFRELPAEYRLVLMTKPDAKLEAMLARYGIAEQTLVTGFRQNPYPWIRQASLLVLCSDHEGLPNVLIESLICGTPVVSTDCPSGPREILQGELRRNLAPCNDAAALGAAMRAALAESRPAPGAYDALLAPYTEARVLTEFENLPQRWRPAA